MGLCGKFISPSVLKIHVPMLYSPLCKIHIPSHFFRSDLTRIHMHIFTTAPRPLSLSIIIFIYVKTQQLQLTSNFHSLSINVPLTKEYLACHDWRSKLQLCKAFVFKQKLTNFLWRSFPMWGKETTFSPPQDKTRIAAAMLALSYTRPSSFSD